MKVMISLSRGRGVVAPMSTDSMDFRVRGTGASGTSSVTDDAEAIAGPGGIGGRGPSLNVLRIHVRRDACTLRLISSEGGGHNELGFWNESPKSGMTSCDKMRRSIH